MFLLCVIVESVPSLKQYLLFPHIQYSSTGTQIQRHYSALCPASFIIFSQCVKVSPVNKYSSFQIINTVFGKIVIKKTRQSVIRVNIRVTKQQLHCFFMSVSDMGVFGFSDKAQNLEWKRKEKSEP